MDPASVASDVDTLAVEAFEVDYNGTVWQGEGVSRIRARGALDGCASLEEVVDRLNQTAGLYRKLIRDGWCLQGVVEDDSALITRR
jgi:hypothetical protein